MNLREDKGLRAIAHAMLAFIGIVLMGAGLALLSGVSQSRPPQPATALVMMRPLDAVPPRHARRPAPPGPEAVAPDASPGPRERRAPKRWSEDAPRLAIVIDDIGHTTEAVQRFLALGYPLTYSVLPDVAHAQEAAALIRRAGREYLIHLPMQPFEYPRQNPGPHPLLLSQGVEETARRVREYMALLPEAVGANNHMGSAYTYNAERMEVVQTLLAEANLFFLNSRTSGTHVPEEVAQRWGYRYLERDVFLDNELDEAAIERAFQQAVYHARRYGRAIAIGHPYPQTWRVLKRNLPRLAAHGVRAVTASSLLAPDSGPHAHASR